MITQLHTTSGKFRLAHGKITLQVSIWEDQACPDGIGGRYGSGTRVSSSTSSSLCLDHSNNAVYPLNHLSWKLIEVAVENL